MAPSREEDRASGGLEGIIESSAIRFAEIIKATGMEPLVEEYDAEEYRIWVLPGLDSLMEWEDGPYPSEVERWARSLEQRIGAARVAFTHIAPLPGRHHTVDHWSRFWDGSQWLGGKAAAGWLLAWVPIPLERFRTVVRSSHGGDGRTR